MNICIIGAGWVGCHLALTLKNDFDVTLYNLTGEVFDGTSIFNQNRLHLGYHYARSHKTRELCKNTFDNFLKSYGHLTDDINNNIYAIPKDESLIDFLTYLKIFEGMSHKQVTDFELCNIEGCINVKEKYINPISSRKFFQEQLNSIIKPKLINKKDLNILSKNYDLVINCSNNLLQPFGETFWEQCIMLVYEKKQSWEFDALTLVDGPLFSIYPYINNTVTLSHVLHTPVYRSNTPKFDRFTEVDYKRSLIEQDVLRFFPNFYNCFEYKNYFTSIKVKHNSKCDDRSPVLNINDNIISCYTGKIQGIFYIEEFIKNEISHWK